MPRSWHAVISAVLACQACQDHDRDLRAFTELNFGKQMSCAEFRHREETACDDEMVRELCCFTCSHKLSLEKQEFPHSRPLEDRFIRLRDGATMPSVALGTSGLSGDSATRAVEFALRKGYRAIDTAIIYGNQKAVGEGLRRSGVARNEVFVISKVPPIMHGYAQGEKAVEQMLEELGVSYVDLCLIHYPGLGFRFQMPAERPDAFTAVQRAGTWRALENAHRSSSCRYIGVSNYLPEHLGELFDYAEVPPAVNQIEYHPYMVDHRTLRFCRQHGVAVQAFGSINARGLLSDPVVSRIAQAIGRSPAQVLLRWALQQGVMVLPKSSDEKRILENAELWDFTLEPSQQQKLTALNRDQRFYETGLGIAVGSYQKSRPWSRWRVGRNVSGV